MINQIYEILVAANRFNTHYVHFGMECVLKRFEEFHCVIGKCNIDIFGSRNVVAYYCLPYLGSFTIEFT